VQQRDTYVLKHLAEEFNLTYTAFGSQISTQNSPAAGALVLSEAWRTGLEPAPVTPSDEDSAPWRLFSGTIKATFSAHRNLDGPNNIFVSPGIMSGNTGECTRPVRVQGNLDNVGRCPQIRGITGTLRATLSGTTTKTGETVAHLGCQTIYIPSTSVRLDSTSEFGLQKLIGLTDMSADNFVEMIRFFTTLILNADESRDM
jgi:Gly-Xaa carboxypeptidase